MTTEEALKEAARFAKSAATWWQDEESTEAAVVAQAAAETSQAYSLLALAYIAEAQA